MKGPSEPGHVVCFGELLLRLSPDPGTRLDRSDRLDLAVGGAEANVAIALSSLGLPVAMLSAVADSPTGRRALAALGAPPDPATRLAWSGRSELVLPGDAGRLVVADEAVDDHELVVGFRRGGERLIRGDGHSLPLKAFCQQRRIPPWIRARLPLIYQGDRLVAVADQWIAPGLSDALAGVLARIGWRHGLTGD